jgi:hypothetical protein
LGPRVPKVLVPRSDGKRIGKVASPELYYLGWPIRRVFRDCELGRLPHWTEGKGQLRFNTAVLDLHRFLPQLFVMVGRDYGPEEVAKCLGLFTLAMQGIRPTQQDIMRTLVKAGVFPAASGEASG